MSFPLVLFTIITPLYSMNESSSLVVVGLDNLPSEVIGHISSYTDPNTILAFSATSRSNAGMHNNSLMTTVERSFPYMVGRGKPSYHCDMMRKLALKKKYNNINFTMKNESVSNREARTLVGKIVGYYRNSGDENDMQKTVGLYSVDLSNYTKEIYCYDVCQEIKECSKHTDYITQFLFKAGLPVQSFLCGYVTNSKPDLQPLLNIACVRGNKDLVAKMLTSIDSINANSCDLYGRTALHKAAERGNCAIISLLLQKGANPNAKDNSDKCPYQLATITHAFNLLYNAAMEKRAINDSYNYNKYDKSSHDSQTLLLEACKNGYTNLVYIILATEDGFLKINHQDQAGNTALHYAARCGDCGLIELLLESGANPCIVNNCHEYPYNYAENGDVSDLLDAAVTAQMRSERFKQSSYTKDENYCSIM
jgi:ankyrin repeat protein